MNTPSTSSWQASLRGRTEPGGWHIGVIGGSGLADGVALEDAQEIEVSSPFGAPPTLEGYGALLAAETP